MILFLHGKESFLINRRRGALEKAFLKKYPSPSGEVFLFDFEDQGSGEDVRKAIGACESGLFASPKLVIFLHPFALSENLEKLLVDFVKEFGKSETETTLLLVESEKIKKTHPLTKALEKVGAKQEVFEALTPKEMIALVKRELEAIDPQMHFSPEALDTFIASVGTDTARLVSELEKLASYKAGERIEVKDVIEMVAGGSESALFDALNALSRGDRSRALFLFHFEAMQSGGAGAYPLLSMCAWQMRRMLIIKEAFESGMRRAGDIARITKLQPFAVEKMLPLLSALPASRIKEGLAMLSDFDTELKQGRMDPFVALDLFVWKF